MKGIVLVLLLLVGVVYSVSEPDMHTLYKKYLKTYEKEYTPTESATRFPLFKASYNKVQAHNTKADAGKYSFRLGMNKFADWTPAEFRARLNAKKPKTSTALFTLKANSSLSTSDSLDWRTLNVVTEVKDQGTCGACWAFASIGAMEGAHAYATSTLVSLSEQEMIDCANDGADTCTVGGEIDDGYQYAISAGGVEKESVYPYLDTSGNTCAFSTANVVATFSSYVDVDTTEEALLTAISTRPTVAVGINAGLDSFMLYESGVYSDSDCSSDEADLDHGVLLVGYGTDSTTGYDYWIIKNSWGSDWGDGGYMKLHRNYNNMCGIADDASYPIV